MSSAVSSRLISGDGARHMACGQEKKSKRVRSEAERGAVTDQFGQYGVIKEADMWDKRPEFMLWCSEVRCLCVRSRVGAPTVGARGVWYAHSDGGGSPCADQEAGSGAVVQVVCRDAAHMRCSIRPTRSPHLSNTLTREGVGGGGLRIRREEKEMFKEFMEDYNTATLPHKKVFPPHVPPKRRGRSALVRGHVAVDAPPTTLLVQQPSHAVGACHGRQRAIELTG